MEIMKQKFYVGLDMGTASVGWAVTDDKYNIIKRHGKALLGVRLFKTANTAEERRTFRCQPEEEHSVENREWNCCRRYSVMKYQRLI